MCQKGCLWNPGTCSCENGSYVRSITDNSVITFTELKIQQKALQ